MEITIRNYGQYSSDNYGANTIRVDVGRLRLWFSYQTLVAFQLDYQDKVVHQNVWTTTTGKHLNWIDNGRRESRVSAEQFTEKLAEAMAACNLAELPDVRT